MRERRDLEQVGALQHARRVQPEAQPPQLVREQVDEVQVLQADVLLRGDELPDVEDALRRGGDGSLGLSITTSMQLCASASARGVQSQCSTVGRSDSSVSMVLGAPTGVQFASPALLGQLLQKSAGGAGRPADAPAVMILTVTLLAGEGPRLCTCT